MKQLSFFPTIYDCNMRKIQIYQRHHKGELSKEFLEYIYETIDMMIDLGMYMTSEIDMALRRFMESGYVIEEEYVSFAKKSPIPSVLIFEMKLNQGELTIK